MAAPKGITDEQVIAVIADPTYSNQAEQAEALGITPQALSERLIRKPDLGVQAREMRLKLVAAHLGPVYKQLLDKARGLTTKGDVAAANTVLKAAGDLVDRTESKSQEDINVKIEANLSGADARRIATAILERSKERK